MNPFRFVACATLLAIAACASPSISSAPSAGAAAGGGVSNAFSAASGAQVGQDVTAASAYCRRTGGAVQPRVPYYDTNAYSGSGKPLRLTGSAVFCTYKSKASSTYGSISVLVTTLFTKHPSLAALAYYAKIRENKKCRNAGQPAACYCSSQLGGADFQNIGEGGAWVFGGLKKSSYLETCMFPDMSSIDSWGLFYHSAGVIRGKDLSTVLRYKPPSTS